MTGGELPRKGVLERALQKSRDRLERRFLGLSCSCGDYDPGVWIYPPTGDPYRQCANCGTERKVQI